MSAVTACVDFRMHDPLSVVAPDHFSAVIHSTLSSEAIAVCLLGGDRIVLANPGFRELFGLRPADPCPLHLSDLVIDADRSWVGSVLAEAAQRTSGPVQLCFQAFGKNGATMDLELHAVRAASSARSGMLAFLFDVRERRRREEQLSFLAFLDSLTGLPNRALFFDRLRETLVEARRTKLGFALLFADLDGFKAVNDRLGHDAGDLVLTIVGDRLVECIRAEDTVARQGGDEFAILLPNLANREDAERLAARMIERVAEPIAVGKALAHVGLSIGIALYPDHAADIDTLFSAADAAMYASKRAGKGRYLMAEVAAECSPISVEFVVWSEVHNVGIEVIDRQHRELVDLVNQLGNALKAGHSRQRLLDALVELIAATRRHFETEERLMAEHGLPHLDVHRRHHRKLLDDVGSLRGDLDRRSMALTMRYLQEWLLRHVDTMDKQLGSLLQQRGVT